MNHVSAFANNWLGDINFKSFFFFCIYLSIFIFIQFPYSNAVLYEDYVSMKINYYCWSLWSTTLTSCYFTIHSFLLEISTTYHYTSFPFCMAIFFSLSLCMIPWPVEKKIKMRSSRCKTLCELADYSPQYISTKDYKFVSGNGGGGVSLCLCRWPNDQYKTKNAFYHIFFFTFECQQAKKNLERNTKLICKSK